MKLIVISPSNAVQNEHAIITAFFEEGLELFHIHKPPFSKEETEKFIQQIPAKYHSRISVHSDLPKFHSLQELKDYKQQYEYAFLSPIFDSISKEGYKSKFSDRLYNFLQIDPDLIHAISGKNIIALGGVDEDKIELARKIGFAGVAVLGAIWNCKDPVKKFKRIQQLCHPGLVSESGKMLKQVQHD